MIPKIMASTLAYPVLSFFEVKLPAMNQNRGVIEIISNRNQVLPYPLYFKRRYPNNAYSAIIKKGKVVAIGVMKLEV
jgi:hypothetical protein